MLFIDHPQVLLDVDNEPRPTYTQSQRFVGCSTISNFDYFYASF